jgi:antitoxin component HigA of HigAB toxin-antitoxin module
LKEIKRRKKMYNQYSIKQRTNMQQSKRNACQWLMNKPITNQIEIDWVQKKVEDFLMVVANAEKEKNEKQRDQWSGLVPYLHLIHCLTDFDLVCAALQHSFTVMTHDQFDGRHNENNMRKCPWTLASDKWNESNYNPKLSIYTNLLKDSIDLAFSKVENMGICTPDKFKSKFSKMKNELVLIRTNYNKSGNGDGSAIETRNSSTGKTPKDELDKNESNIAMMDCNKKGSFLNGRSSAVLYLWEKAEEYNLLSTVCQQLSPDTSFDSTEIDNVEDISLKGRKRKKLEDKNNDDADNDLLVLKEVMDESTSAIKDSTKCMNRNVIMNLISVYKNKLDGFESKLDELDEDELGSTSSKRQQLKKRRNETSETIEELKEKLKNVG